MAHVINNRSTIVGKLGAFITAMSSPEHVPVTIDGLIQRIIRNATVRFRIPRGDVKFGRGQLFRFTGLDMTLTLGDYDIPGPVIQGCFKQITAPRSLAATWAKTYRTPERCVEHVMSVSPRISEDCVIRVPEFVLTAIGWHSDDPQSETVIVDNFQFTSYGEPFASAPTTNDVVDEFVNAEPDPVEADHDQPFLVGQTADS